MADASRKEPCPRTKTSENYRLDIHTIPFNAECQIGKCNYFSLTRWWNQLNVDWLRDCRSNHYYFTTSTRR